MRRALITLGLIVFTASIARAEESGQMLDQIFHHLRIAGPREWSEFPEQAECAKSRSEILGKAQPQRVDAEAQTAGCQTDLERGAQRNKTGATGP